MYYIVEQEITDYYNQKVPAGACVQRNLNQLSLMPRPEEFKQTQYLYFPQKVEQPKLREPSEAELAQILASIEARPLLHKFGYIHKPMLGADPEIFVIDGHGGVIPAYKFLPPDPGRWNFDNIDNPPPPPYWDGFQAEFKIRPGTCIAYLVDRVHAQLASLLKRAQKYDPHARLTAEPVLPVPQEELAGADEIYTQLGCSPSRNAYGTEGLPVLNGRDLPFRFAGTHVHCSWENLTLEKCVQVIKTIDAIAGVVSVLLLQGLESPIRRRYYGLAGEYRKPSYGFEYRVLSSAVMWHPAVYQLMLGLVRFAANIESKNLRKYWQASEEEVQETINFLDLDQARRICERNRTFLEDVLYQVIYIHVSNHDWPEMLTKLPVGEVLEELVYQGVGQFLEQDMEKNWYLKKSWNTHASNPKVQIWSALHAWFREA